MNSEMPLDDVPMWFAGIAIFVVFGLSTGIYMFSYRPSIKIPPADLEGLAQDFYANHPGVSKFAVGCLLVLGMLALANEWGARRAKMRARREEAIAVQVERKQARDNARAERSENLAAAKARWEAELQDRREIRVFELERERYQVRRFQLQLRIAMELNARASGSTAIGSTANHSTANHSTANGST